jgi:integrase
MALYKRPGSKYYWMKFTFDGQLIQQSTKCKARRDAETVESAYRTQLALGKVGIRAKKKAETFLAAAIGYLEWYGVTHANKPGSTLRMKYSVGSLIAHFGARPCDQIEKSDVEKFVLARSKRDSNKGKQKITGDTINLELTALKAIFKRLVSDGMLHDNPAADVKHLPHNDRTFYVLDRDEENRFLMASPQPLQDVATVMLETGMRPKEIYELKRSNVDLAAGSVKVVDGKTQSSNRRVWLTERAAAVIRRRVHHFKGDYLFPKNEIDHEGPTHPLNTLHRTARTRAGLPVTFRLYDCRHTFATRALESGVDLITLASMLGHSNLDQLQRYAHPSETRKKEATMEMSKRSVKAI